MGNLLNHPASLNCVIKLGDWWWNVNAEENTWNLAARTCKLAFWSPNIIKCSKLSALGVNFFHSPDDQLPQTPRSTVFVDTSFKGKEKHCPNKRMISKWKGKTDILPGKWTWITDFINCSGWLIIRWHWVPSTSYPTMVANSQYGRQSSVNICLYILRIVSWVGTPPCYSLQKHCS